MNKNSVEVLVCLKLSNVLGLNSFLSLNNHPFQLQKSKMN